MAAVTSPGDFLLGVTATGATPHNLYLTKIYTIEYDGVADFPRYPLNFVSDLNAIAWHLLRAILKLISS